MTINEEDPVLKTLQFEDKLRSLALLKDLRSLQIVQTFKKKQLFPFSFLKIQCDQLLINCKSFPNGLFTVIMQFVCFLQKQKKTVIFLDIVSA